MENASLKNVAEVIAGDVFGYARQMYSKTGHPGLARYVGSEDIRSLNEVIETARTETSFLLDPAIANVFSGCDINFTECKKTPTTIYVVMPGDIMDGRVFNLILNSALGELLRYVK